MSEVQTRPPPRGRGSARGGRGGFSSRGGRGGNRTAKSDPENVQPSYEDEGELGQLKKKYSTSLPMIKELFPDWTDEDLVFALEDANGDLENAIERITEGNVSQWGEVKKKTDRSRPKAKEPQPTQTEAAPVPPARGGRGRGGFDTRGRARGDRGRGGRGGRAGAHVNGTRAEKTTTAAQEAPVPDAWPTQEPINEAKPAAVAPATITEPSEKPAPKSSIIPEGSKKGWASLFAPPPPQKKAPLPSAAPEKPAQKPVDEKPAEQPTHLDTIPQAEAPSVAQQPAEVPPPQVSVTSTDELTKSNLEQVPDASPPAPATTVASTGASTQDHTSVLSAVTASQPRPAIPSYAGSQYKTAATPGRGPALQRRVMEQQEAVVMPGNHAVDRAAVQFGSMGLNGDIDEEREEPETRPQPPQHSPVAPRASLPPSTQAHAPTENVAVPRPAPGLPPAPVSAAEAQFNDFGRYGEPQKPYDPFGQQLEQPQPQAQEPFSNQAPIPGQPVATSAADYSAFYGGDQSRNPYYYGSYGQSQEAAQRPGAGFGVSGADMQPQLASTQPPSRYAHAEASTSGQTTPNPTLPAQAQQAQPSQHMPQAQGGHGFNYYPYYSSPHYANTYMNQMGGQHQYGRNRPMYDDARRYEDHYLHGNQFGYNNQFAGPYGKGGMYGQPQHGFSYDHASSPANAGGFPGRESSYARTGSAQPSEAQQTAGHTAFGGIGDVFGRGQSGYGQAPPIAQQQPVSAEESAKGFDATKASGPSPSLAQVNRPGSATNSVPGQPQAVQGGLPPVPNQQAFAGGYPLNPQYSGLSGLGGHASQTHHQAGAYGNYGGFGNNNYYGSTGRGGGWGGNYGH